MNRVLNMLGLCMRAGRIVSGEKAVVQAVRMGAACVVLLDGGAAANAEKDISDACAYYEVPLIRTDADALGYAIGKPGRMAAAVTDPSMADRILELQKTVR